MLIHNSIALKFREQRIVPLCPSPHALFTLYFSVFPPQDCIIRQSYLWQMFYGLRFAQRTRDYNVVNRTIVKYRRLIGQSYISRQWKADCPLRILLENRLANSNYRVVVWCKRKWSVLNTCEHHCWYRQSCAHFGIMRSLRVTIAS